MNTNEQTSGQMWMLVASGTIMAWAARWAALVRDAESLVEMSILNHVSADYLEATTEQA